MHDDPGIMDDGNHLTPVSDNAGIMKQPQRLRLSIRRNLSDIKTIEGPTEILLFLQYQCPAQTRLVDLQDKAPEQLIVLSNRKAMNMVMMDTVDVALREVAYLFAV